MKDDRVQINIKFNSDKEGDLLAYIKSLPNIQRHIKGLLQRELDALRLGGGPDAKKH